ncbi:MAG: bifunctional oligoribonuclease/PAP phosphatase NrnA [Elusimicrobiota bacterium]
MNYNLDIPADDAEIISRIILELRKAGSVFITMHARPDGDAIGAAMAMYYTLENLGIDTEIVAPDPCPLVYRFLRDTDIIKTSYPSAKKDVGIVLDCSDEKRLENIPDILDYADVTINIDHHMHNPEFGSINYIRPGCSSTCEMIFNIISRMNIDLDYETALCIYVGIITDTNKFQEDNTTPRAHIIAAELIEKFISPVKVTSLIYGNNNLNTFHLLSMAIDSLKLSPSGRIGYITVSNEMLKTTGTSNEDLEGLINYARNIRGVEVGVLFRNIPDKNGVKVSFRSKGHIDVSKVAGYFGGGGHHNAAGCLVEGDFDEVRLKILGAVEKDLNKHHGRSRKRK